MCVYCVYLLCIYKYTHMHVYISEKNDTLCLYIKYIYRYNKLHEYKCIHVNIFQIYTVCVCIYIYIINIHSTHTYLVILDVINRLCCQIINSLYLKYIYIIKAT